MKRETLLLFIVGITLFIWYFFGLLLGGDSFLKVAQLENEKEYLKKRVIKLKKENALLQKEYFELKELENE